MERWKLVEGTHYEISTEGNLRNSKNQKLMKPTTDRYGYYRTTKYDTNGQQIYPTIHRLVAEAFLPNPHNKPQVNHINGIKTDNRIENLEWCTAGENIRHAMKNGLYPDRKQKRKRNTEIWKDGNWIGIFPSLTIACQFVGVSVIAGSKSARGVSKSTAEGYIFKYV